MGEHCVKLVLLLLLWCRGGCQWLPTQIAANASATAAQPPISCSCRRRCRRAEWGYPAAAARSRSHSRTTAHQAPARPCVRFTTTAASAAATTATQQLMTFILCSPMGQQPKLVLCTTRRPLCACAAASVGTDCCRALRTTPRWSPHTIEAGASWWACQAPAQPRPHSRGRIKPC